MGRPKGSKNKLNTDAIPGGEIAREQWDEAASQAAQGRLRIDEGPREERVDLQLERELTETEFVEAAVEMARTKMELDRREEALAAAKLEYQAKTKEIKEPAGSPTSAELGELESRLSKEVSSRKRVAETSCRKVIDGRRFVVSYYRLDRGDPEIGELHEERPMTTAERNAEVFDTPEEIEVNGEDGGNE